MTPFSSASTLSAILTLATTHLLEQSNPALSQHERGRIGILPRHYLHTPPVAECYHDTIRSLLYYTQITMLQCQIRGIESTRRDALALCIRFASYRIAEKHGILAPIYPTSPTSVGEDSFFDGASRMAISLGDGDKGYADISLRQPPDVINAIESQVLCGVAIIRKIGCDLLAPSTCDVAYHETRSDDGDHEFRRRPVIDPTSVATKASRAPISPIIPEETWECFVQSLPHFGGDASQARRATKAQMTVSLSWAPVSRL